MEVSSFAVSLEILKELSSDDRSERAPDTYQVCISFISNGVD